MGAILHFVKFKDLHNWSAAHLLKNNIKFNKKYKVIKLKNILSKSDIEWVKIEDEKQYPILGVHAQGQGVYINKVVYGKELTMKKYQISKAYHLFYCKVRTVKGQWGVVYPEFENSYASSNMQYLKIDLSTILPEYLEMLLKLKTLTDIWDKNAIGADGRHFNLSTLLNLQIPLPTIKQQKELLQKYQEKIELAKKQEKEVRQKEKEIEDYLYKELGIEVSNKKENNILNFVKFKYLDRWDVSYLLDNKNITSKYDLIPISKIINTFLKDINNNSLRIETKKFPDKDFKYIGMENIEKNTGRLINFQYVKGIDIKSQTIKLPYNFFIYGKLRPYLNKYFLNHYKDENIIVSSEFFVFSLKDINELYFKYVIGTLLVQKQIENQMKGARMPRISEKTFKNLKIPYPPIEIQNKISDYISDLKKEVKKLNEQAKQNRLLALQEFEREIFNEA
ncbi:MAG TPA: restriction endonuclease subunit S [Bacteroidia bacterium]|nr:restriction endonuclease subunit S [Bacteroidia bacterium]